MHCKKKKSSLAGERPLPSTTALHSYFGARSPANQVACKTFLAGATAWTFQGRQISIKKNTPFPKSGSSLKPIWEAAGHGLHSDQSSRLCATDQLWLSPHKTHQEQD